MFKKISILATLGLVAASCHVKEDRVLCTVPVSVHVNDFSVSMEDFPTKAGQNAAAYSGVKALTLAFYAGDGTETYKTVQTRDALEEDETFGEFSLSLPMGSYTMVVIGHGLNDGEPSVTLTGPTSATFGNKPARETFICTKSVTINNTAAVDISATLNRIVSKLQVASSDVMRNPAYSVRMTFAAGGKSFNPTTGLATSNSGFSNEVVISTGTNEVSKSNSYLFLATEEQTMDVTVDVLDAEGQVLSHKVATGVPFQRNRTTKLTGAMYTNESVGSSFLLETDWLTDYEDNF